MKSIKEKAEAYDKVLEWATEAHKVCDGMLKEDLEHLFPELKESEDEKVRKWLIGYLENRMLNCSLIDEKENCKTAVAWLEKQCEQKPILSMPVFKEGDILYNKDSFASDSIFIFKGMSKTNAYLCYARLYGEKNFSVYSKEDWDKGAGIYGGEFYPANHKQKELLFSKMEESGYRWNPDQKKMEKIEQKPAWSEGDKVMLDKVIERLHKHSAGDKEYLDIYYWLIALKDRVQPQPKQEWKPSDEQIELLREVQQALLGKDCHNRFVNFMYELKRLREE